MGVVQVDFPFSLLQHEHGIESLCLPVVGIRVHPGDGGADDGSGFAIVELCNGGHALDLRRQYLATVYRDQLLCFAYITGLHVLPVSVSDCLWVFGRLVAG